MVFSKEMANNFAEWFEGTLEHQSTAQPCIYYYQGRIDFSPGSTTGGTAAPVYSGEAEIIIDKEWWNRYDFTTQEKGKGNMIYKEIQEFLEEVERRGEIIPQLLGVTDVAKKLGWTKGKVSEYRRRGFSLLRPLLLEVVLFGRPYRLKNLRRKDDPGKREKTGWGSFPPWLSV